MAAERREVQSVSYGDAGPAPAWDADPDEVAAAIAACRVCMDRAQERPSRHTPAPSRWLRAARLEAVGISSSNQSLHPGWEEACSGGS